MREVQRSTPAANLGSPSKPGLALVAATAGGGSSASLAASAAAAGAGASGGDSTDVALLLSAAAVALLQAQPALAEHTVALGYVEKLVRLLAARAPALPAGGLTPDLIDAAPLLPGKQCQGSLPEGLPGGPWDKGEWMGAWLGGNHQTGSSFYDAVPTKRMLGPVCAAPLSAWQAPYTLPLAGHADSACACVTGAAVAACFDMKCIAPLLCRRAERLAAAPATPAGGLWRRHRGARAVQPAHGAAAAGRPALGHSGLWWAGQQGLLGRPPWPCTSRAMPEAWGAARSMVGFRSGISAHDPHLACTGLLNPACPLPPLPPPPQCWRWRR